MSAKSPELLSFLQLVFLAVFPLKISSTQQPYPTIMEASTPGYDLVLAIDLGTTSTKICLYAEDGDMMTPEHCFTLQTPQLYPEVGWHEHCPKAVYGAVVTCLNSHPQLAPRTRRIGITNHRESVVVWHRDSGEELSNIIIWVYGHALHQCCLC